MWKDEFFNKMFEKDFEKFNYYEALKYKYDNLPISLYKYKQINDYTINNLKEDVIWLSCASEFNDPFDSGLTVNKNVMYYEKLKKDIIKDYCETYNVDLEKVETLLEEFPLEVSLTMLYTSLGLDHSSALSKAQLIISDTEDIYDDYLDKMNDLYQKSTFVTCFSENPESILMWSHYADNHKGICLEYDFKSFDLTNEFVQHLYPVKYTQKRFDLENYKLDNSRNHINTSTLASLHKALDWEYEKEWRLVYHDFDRTGSYELPFVKPKTIILGAKIDEEQKQKILEVALDKDINVKQIKLDKDNFKLKVLPI